MIFIRSSIMRHYLPTWIYQLNEPSPEIWLTPPVITLGAQIDTDYKKLITQFVYKGKDIRPGNSHTIDYDELNTQIHQQESSNIAIDYYSKQYIILNLEFDRVIADATGQMMNDDKNRVVFPILEDLAN